MRYIPYTYDVLVYIWRAKVNLSDFDVLVYYDPIKLTRGSDQPWINNNNHPLLMHNILSQSACIMGVRNLMIISDNDVYSSTVKSYADKVYFSTAEIKAQNLLNSCRHYWLSWYVQNPAQVKVIEDPFWKEYFSNWCEKRSITKFILLQVREKPYDNESRSNKGQSNQRIISSVISWAKSFGYDVVIMPDYYNSDVKFEGAFTYTVGPSSLMSRLAAYKSAQINIVVDQIGPFFLSMISTNRPSLIIHHVESKNIDEYVAWINTYFMSDGRVKVNKRFDISKSNSFLVLSENHDESEISSSLNLLSSRYINT
jgi:hypothetical protein